MESLLGRTALKALGLNTSEVLLAAAKANEQCIDFNELLSSVNYAKTTIAGVLSDNGTFHVNIAQNEENYDPLI